MGVKQRKVVSTEGEQSKKTEEDSQKKTEEKTKKIEKDTKLTSKNATSSGSSSSLNKVFVGLLAVVLAALLYNREYISRTLTPEGRGKGYLRADVERRDAVVTAFRHAWLSYERDAMGADNYHPISKTGSNLTDAGGIGYTVVGALDTIQLMGLDSEYQRARKWVSKSLSFNRDGEYNTAEVTNRVLGGLLSAYHLSGDVLYLERAKDLADRIMPAFNTPSGFPVTNTNLRTRIPVEDPNNVVSTAEVAGIQLELRYLSHLTQNYDYWDKAENSIKALKNANAHFGLPSVFIGSDNGRYLTSQVRLGFKTDAYYEYLLKQYLQTSKSEPVYREMYADAMTAIHNRLLQKSPENNLTYAVELIPEARRRGRVDWNTEQRQDHIACFIGGSLLLGATTSGASGPVVSVPPLDEELTESARRDWKTGLEFIDTCMDTYKRTATGLAADVVHFRRRGDGETFYSGNLDWYIKGSRPPQRPPPYDARYMLRPETVESLFLAYRLTGDEIYRQHGWDIFQSIEKYCRVESGGYATILNVDDAKSKLEDKMEPFFLSETLKYLFLLFSDSTVLPLNKYVLNTEAHPLPIFTPDTKREWSTTLTSS